MRESLRGRARLSNVPRVQQTTGAIIRKARQRRFLTQAQLAERLGVAREAVSAWERGRHSPLRYAGAIEEVLGITLPDPEPAAAS